MTPTPHSAQLQALDGVSISAWRVERERTLAFLRAASAHTAKSP